MKPDDEKKLESNTNEIVGLSQVLEIAIFLFIINEIKYTLNNPEKQSQSLSNIRKNTEKEVNNYLPLIISGVSVALKSNYDDVVKGLKGSIPKYSKTFEKETEDYFKKYMNTKGTNFIVGKGQKIPQYFTTFIEKEVKGVVDGSISVEDAIKKAVKELSDSGLKVVNYDSGVRRNIDVFVRQQMLYAQKQSAQDLRDRFAEENGITIFEFDAHPNARPTHQKWQGKRYDTTGKYYPTLEELTHGEHNDYGCKHRSYPVYDKEDKYMFTKDQLNNINTKPFEWNGKKYDGYEATQKQRLYERQIRALKRQKILNDELGIKDDSLEYRLNKKEKEYSRFCKAFGTYERKDRTNVEF